jgi:1-phosphofructokinase family hexose kinase
MWIRTFPPALEFMFLTVTPNPCIEKTFLLETFQPGASHRVSSGHVQRSLGGKGLNAARVAATLGAKTTALTLVGHREMDWAREELQVRGIEPVLVPTSQETRLCVNLVHQGTNTEVLEAGSPLEISEGTQLLDHYARLVRQADFVALCGSYPQSTNPAWDLHPVLLCDLARKAGKHFIYDGYGAGFARVMRSTAKPWMIKPNLDEASQYLRRPIVDRRAELATVRELMRRGPEVVMLTCGARGAYLGHRGGIEWLAAPQVDTVSAVGSGDSLLGAFIATLARTGSLVEAARCGVAAGALNAASPWPAQVEANEVAQLAATIQPKNCEMTLQLI